MDLGTGCFDQSRYFCESTTCLPQQGSDSTCINYFSGFGAPCPANATCINGKYRCDYGFTDTFHLDHYITDSTDCTACQMPKACIRDPTVPFLPEDSINSFTYSYDQYAEVYLGDMCGKRVIINGCEGYNYWGDTYFYLYGSSGGLRASNDDSFGHLCSYIEYQFEDASPFSTCNGAYVVLRCFSTRLCGGTVSFEGVDRPVVTPCPQGSYYFAVANTTQPCLTCPEGTSNFGEGNFYCNDCVGNYFGYGGTAPCVPCPPGTVANDGSDACIPCNANTLPDMTTDDVYERCFEQLLSPLDTLEQRIDGFIERFESYLTDIKYQQPTFPPTMRPTRRRRSAAPTNMEA
jgi:hypothetical protein